MRGMGGVGLLRKHCVRIRRMRGTFPATIVVVCVEHSVSLYG